LSHRVADRSPHREIWGFWGKNKAGHGQEGDKVMTLPAIPAVMRSQIAVNGNRPAHAL
jgi:hypothetical protein